MKKKILGISLLLMAGFFLSASLSLVGSGGGYTWVVLITAPLCFVSWKAGYVFLKGKKEEG